MVRLERNFEKNGGSRFGAVCGLLAIVWAIMLVALALIPSGQQPLTVGVSDKLQHAVAYGGLALLVQLGLHFRWRVSVWRSAWIATLMAGLGWGLTTEICQELLTTSRHFEWGDLAADGVGALTLTSITATVLTLTRFVDQR